MVLVKKTIYYEYGTVSAILWFYEEGEEGEEL